MAKSVRGNILEEVPDVIIMVAGTPHIKGLDQQLHELKDSRKIVVGNFPEMSNPFDVYLYSGNPKLVDGVGEVIRFDVDLSQGKVVIPALVASAISDRQEQIRTDFSRTDKPQENLTLSSVTKSHMSDVLEQIEAKRIIDALDLAKLNPAKADQKGENQKQSWVEKMTDKKLSAIKGGAREL